LFVIGMKIEVYTGIINEIPHIRSPLSSDGRREGLVMDVAKILAELKSEREQIEEAILSLERLARGRTRGRGRPPSWMAEVETPKRRGRPPGSKNKTQAAGTPAQTIAVA
jgi:hypothetical protein